MPKVGKKSYPYTPAGKAAAKEAIKAKAIKKKKKKPARKSPTKGYRVA